ncbi:MAG: 4'-phosphopantetheinyl transferase superfamily protein [Methanobrevibacter thaueri]|nr:4'-phosphopantetheinyl transferase superfamily protein [Methanobrevibacter thaueri]
MIKVAYCDVSSLDLVNVYNLLPENRKIKVDSFRFDKDKKLSAGAYLLLDKLLCEEGITNPVFEYGKYGKAYISNYENIYFNMSHSNKLVACAISDSEVGIDIEMCDPTIDLNIAKHYFYNSEYENIQKSKNQLNEFFKYWVLKESYMKYTGEGFNKKLDSFEIIINNEITLKNNPENIKFSLFEIKNYKLAISSKYPVKKIKKYEINDIF